MRNTDTITIQLTAPTVFADLNAKQELDADHARSEVQVSRLKFKTFRAMSALPEERQMMFAISELTGLSENDIDELYTEDAAAITQQIIGFMQSFIDITKRMMSPEPAM